MRWLGIHFGRGRASADLAGSNTPAPDPSLTEIALDFATRVSDRDIRLVRDVAGHVTSKVVPIVEMHGRTMENALQANGMAIEVALRLGLEAAQRAALTAIMQGASLEGALAKLDDAIEILTDGLRDHRLNLAAAIEAVHAGVAGGQVRR